MENEWPFAIKDNGIGIDENKNDKIFEIFSRLYSVKEYAGSGIGLAICQKIVEHHGGKIWITSQRSTGSIFYFTIPKE